MCRAVRRAPKVDSWIYGMSSFGAAPRTVFTTHGHVKSRMLCWAPGDHAERSKVTVAVT